MKKNILNFFLMAALLILSPPVWSGGGTDVVQKTKVDPIRHIQQDLNMREPTMDQRVLNICIFRNAKIPDNLMKLWEEEFRNEISPFSPDQKAVLMQFLGDGYCCGSYETPVDLGLFKTVTGMCIGINASSLASTISNEGQKLMFCNRELYDEYSKNYPDKCGNSIAAQFLPLPDYQKFVDCQLKLYEGLTSFACGGK